MIFYPNIFFLLKCSPSYWEYGTAMVVLPTCNRILGIPSLGNPGNKNQILMLIKFGEVRMCVLSDFYPCRINFFLFLISCLKSMVNS